MMLQLHSKSALYNLFDKKRFLLVCIFALFIFIATPSLVSAETYGAKKAAQTAGLDTEKSGASGVNQIIGNVIGAALSMVGVLFFVLVVYGGVMWMTARGDEDQVQSGRSTIITASIGLVVILSSYAITSFVLGSLPTGSTTSPGSGGSPGGGSGNGGNGSCQSDADCTGGTWCKKSSNVCIKARSKGSKCSRQSQCGIKMNCVGPKGKKICLTPNSCNSKARQSGYSNGVCRSKCRSGWKKVSDNASNCSNSEVCCVNTNRKL